MKKNIVLSLLTGIMIALALPPFKTGFIAYGALIPFFLLLEKKSLSEAWRWGYVTGFCIAVFTLFWIGWVTMAGLFGVLLVWPLYIALFAVLHVFFLRTLSSMAYLFMPFLWTGIEYLQSLSELAFPWNYIGYTQSYYLPFIQFADITGIYGVSFWVVGLNVLLFMLWKNVNTNKRLVFGLSLILLFLLPLPYGFIKLNQPEIGRELKVSLIQGNRDPNEKWNGDVKESNYRIYEEMTKQALVEQPDVVVWPETAMPFYLRSESQYLKRIRTLIDSADVSLLTGAIDYEYLEDGSYEHFNSVFMIEPGYHTIQRYAKMKLVPFSERVPYKNYFPFNVLKDLLWDLGLGDYALGRQIATITGRFRATPSVQQNDSTQVYRTAVAICYESVFPDHVRKYVNKGADFLIIITNDAWFGKTSGPFQHAQAAAFRAIETRRDIARCANTGISCFIDRYGRLEQQTPLFKPAAISDTVILNDEQTFYTLHGNLFAVFVSIVSGLTIFIALVKKLLR